MRFFNTTAPVVAEDHDCIPPLKQLGHAGIRRLIREKRHFIFHAPRQTGKTSALLTLRDLLIREDGLGRLRTDLLIVWSQGEMQTLLAQHTEETGQVFNPAALETIWTQTQGQPWLVNALAYEACLQTIAESLAQTADYVDRCDAEAGHLAIFDRREDRQWRDEIFQGRRAAGSGIAIDGWGM